MKPRKKTDGLGLILALGRPTHLSGRHGLPVCGSLSKDVTEDRRKVDCLRCRKSNIFRYLGST